MRGEMYGGMALDFTAIDFETANSHRSSACSVALVKVRDGSPVNVFETFVTPPTGIDSFTNTWVHGIGPADVRDAPPWQDVLRSIIKFVGGDILVAHNASFDASVLLRSSEAVGYQVTGQRFVCTLRAARALLCLGSYSLPFVVKELGLSPFDHHNALNDAGAAAAVAVGLAERAGVESIEALGSFAESRAMRGHRTLATAADWASVAAADCLAGETICFTGGLATMPRDEAWRLVETLGGVAQPGVTKQTTILVTGDFDPRTFRPGAAMTAKLEKAFALAAKGQPIQVMTEAEFLQLVDITDAEVAQVKVAALANLTR